MNLTNENKPVIFKLPDDDEVALIPWAYVIDRLTIDLQDTVSKLQMINTSLAAIDAKLSDWTTNEEG